MDMQHEVHETPRGGGGGGGGSGYLLMRQDTVRIGSEGELLYANCWTIFR